MTTTSFRSEPAVSGSVRASRAGGPTLLAAGAVAAEAFAIWLTVDALRVVGHSVYDLGRAPTWAAVALPLAGAGLLGAVAGELGGRFGVGLSMWSRRRTLALALDADIDETRREGAGRALARAIDGDLLGSFLVATGPAGALGAVELVAAVAILAVAGSAATLLIVAAALVIGLASACWLHAKRATWSRSRSGITDRLVEQLGAPETISLQGDAETTNQEGRELLAHYCDVGRRMDAAALALSVIPTAAFVALVIVAVGSTAPGDLAAETTIAATLAGALLAASGLDRLAAVAVDIVGALDASRGMRQMESGSRPVVPEPDAAVGNVLLEADSIMVELPGGGGLQTPIDLRIERGDRMVLVGSSGCGKTTIAEVLSSERAPTAGRLLRGPDVVVARVPQAGDDHLFQASILFNVLCQHNWPPTPDDTDRAESLLIELGLGALLDLMPAGISQPIGDGGWRLSSGEAARVSLARALIRRPDVVILDETVAALDTASGTRALETTTRYSNATVLIAHP